MDVVLELDLADVCRRGIKQYVTEVKARAKDLRPAWTDVLDVIHRSEMALFENEGRSSENPGGWDELSDNPRTFKGRELPGYATWKRAHYPGAKILELTGRLKAQMTGFDDTAYVRRGTRKLTFGSNYPVSGGGDLGGIHSEGRVMPNYMPAREPIIVDTEETYDMAGRILDYVLDAPDPDANP